MDKAIKQIKLNGLIYNFNRDPAVYRRVKNQAFDLKVDLQGNGQVTAKLLVEGNTLAEQQVNLPGSFVANPSFETAGTRVGTILLEEGANIQQAYVRFDVLEHAWVG